VRCKPLCTSKIDDWLQIVGNLCFCTALASFRSNIGGPILWVQWRKNWLLCAAEAQHCYKASSRSRRRGRRRKRFTGCWQFTGHQSSLFAALCCILVFMFFIFCEIIGCGLGIVVLCKLGDGVCNCVTAAPFVIACSSLEHCHSSSRTSRPRLSFLLLRIFILTSTLL
jgi:hypothetical protein